MAHIICWRSGQVEVRSSEPEGGISLMRGSARRLKTLLEACARHAYDGKTLLVPGIPEADDDDAAYDAMVAFAAFLKKRVRPRSGR